MSQEMKRPGSQSAGQELLKQRWSEGAPMVAFWGQQVGWSLDMPDPVLKRALEHASRSSGQAWNALLTTHPLEEEFYDWLAERFRNRPASQLVIEAARAPWGAIFTSSFDNGLASCIGGEGREPEIILQGQPSPRALRNTRRPPFYYLFGQAGRQVDGLKPPQNRQKLSQRRMTQTSVMLNRVLETVTPLGLLVIDGYDPSTDWLRAEDLLAAISGAPSNGVLWCGPNPTFSEDDQIVFEELVSQGIVVREPRALGVIVNELKETIGVPESTCWDDPEIITLKNSRSIKTTPNLRLVTQASAVLVDDSWAVMPDVLSPSELELEFEAFHANSTSFRKIADGLHRGFAFEREFEQVLRKRVDQALEHHHAASAIVLHGQSGVGKTIAMARLAIHAKRQGNAVLFFNRRVPQASDITDFLTAVDSQQGVTLLLVDTMSPLSRYDDLLRALRSVGHRVVVVGSSYRLSFSGSTASRFIEARAQLTTAERSHLVEVAQKYVPSVTGQVKKQPDNEYVLAGFYRLLPHSRGRLSEGLGREVDRVRHELRKKASRIPPQEPGPLALAFIKAGFPVDTRQFLPDASVDGSSESPEARAIDLVMASSRLYKPVPLSIVLRAVGADHGLRGTFSIDSLLELIRDQDLFRWIYADEEQTDVLVTARLQIEARLICEARFGSATLEAEALRKLIEAAVRSGPEGNDETAYVADLVHAVGPDGPEGDRYKASYAQIARSLSTLRAKTTPNARLMLQESVLRRHYVRTHKNIDQSTKAALLNEAVTVVDEAFERINLQGASGLYAARQTVDNLWNERAATYGFFATDAVENGQNAPAWSAYKAAHEAATLAKARRESSFSLDVSLWMPTGILKAQSTLTESQRLEIAADLRSSIDGVDESSLDEVQRHKFQARRMSAGAAMGDQALTEDAFVRLDQAGSAAGYFIRARYLAPDIKPHTSPSDEDITGAQKCINYLRKHYDKISQDERCLRLLLDMEWAVRTRKWFMRGFRQPFPVSTDFRQLVQGILGDMTLLGEDKLATKYRYLRAVIKWLEGNEMTSRELWAELASDTEYADAQRVSSLHLLTDGEGVPILYRGIVEKQLGAGRFQVRVDGMGVIDLLAEYFPTVEIAFGRTVSNFHIAFNYRGPLADPQNKPRRLGR